MKRNSVAKAVRSPLYRARVVQDKKRQQKAGYQKYKKSF
jgi:hypothetical protein